MSNRDKSSTDKPKGKKKKGLDMTNIMEKSIKKKFDEVKKENPNPKKVDLCKNVVYRNQIVERIRENERR